MSPCESSTKTARPPHRAPYYRDQCCLLEFIACACATTQSETYDKALGDHHRRWHERWILRPGCCVCGVPNRRPLVLRARRPAATALGTRLRHFVQTGYASAGLPRATCRPANTTCESRQPTAFVFGGARCTASLVKFGRRSRICGDGGTRSEGLLAAGGAPAR